MDRRLQHVHTAIDLARFLAGGQQRAITCRRKETADAGAGGADAFGQVALRGQFQLDLAGAVERVEMLGISLAWKGADDLAYPPRRQQCGQPGVAVAGIVVDDGEFARALLDQSIDQRRRHAGIAKTANHDGCAVMNIGHGALD